MKIGILSDTHAKEQRAKKALDKLLQDGAEFIVHAGDIITVETLELLKNCGKKYIAVYGNNDSHLIQYHKQYNLVIEPYYFELADTKFKLMHLPFYMSGDAEVVLSGHTHKFSSEFYGKTLFLNPGEVCAREKPLSEYVMLEISKDEFLVTYYTNDIQANTLNKKELSYKRIKHEK